MFSEFKAAIEAAFIVPVNGPECRLVEHAQVALTQLMLDLETSKIRAERLVRILERGTKPPEMKP